MPACWTLTLLGFVVGSALQLQQAMLGPVWGYGAALLAGLGLLGVGWRWPRWRGLALLGAALLAWGSVGLRAQVLQQQALNPALEGRDLVLQGRVTAMPQRNAQGLRFRFAVESAWLEGQPVTLPPAIWLAWWSGEDEGATPPWGLRAGERWRLPARLKAPHGNRNPHGFDYELWLWEQGLQATGSVRVHPSLPAPQRLAVTAWHPMEQARQSVRDALQTHVTDPRWAGLLAALVVGEQSAIERADWDVFRATGVAHLMSISGLHITLFAWAAVYLLGGLWRRSARLCLWYPAPVAGLVVGVACASAYAVFSGWGLPAQRTVCMLVTAAVLRLSARVWPRPLVWLLALAVVVAADPWALLQPGFWLSFVAVGVLFASDPARVSAAPATGWRRSLTPLLSLLREQWVMTLALTPLSVFLFQQVSVVGFVANALAIPWVTLLLTPLALAGVLWHPLWHAAVWAAQALALWLEWLAAWPGAMLSMAAPPLGLALAALVGGVLLALRLPGSLRLLGLPLLLPLLLWQPPRPAPGRFELLAADVGQGNAVIVRTAGHTLVYDTGPRFSRESDAGQRTLVPLLRALGERVDMLVLSHRDSDHTGGAAAVLAMQPQAQLLSSLESGHALQSQRPATRCEAGQTWEWDGVRFAVLHPQAVDYTAQTGQAAQPNARSCVLRVESTQTSTQAAALLVGDIEQPQEAALLARAAPIKADWLLVPHHGSKTSSSAAFLQAVAPRVAVVQAGYRNRYGHPAAPVLQRYQDQQLPVWDSSRCGAAWWRSERPAQVQCEREQHPHYWQHRLP